MTDMSRAEAFAILRTAAEYGFEQYCLEAGIDNPSRGLRTLVRAILGRQEPLHLPLSTGSQVNWWPCVRRCARVPRIAWSNTGPDDAVCVFCREKDIRR